MHYMLVYDVVPDYVERRQAFRSQHLSLATDSVGRGELLLGGAAGEPVDRAWLLFESPSAEIPSNFAESDPYVLNGLVTSWEVIPWHTVVGSLKSNEI